MPNETITAPQTTANPSQGKQQVADKNIEDIYLLSPMQQGLLFHTLLEPNSDSYFLQTSWTIESDLNVGALREAWQLAIDRHPILRTACFWEGRAKPVQVVRRKVKLPLTEEDWRGMSEDEQQRLFDQRLFADRRLGFNLSQAPLMRLLLIQLSDSR
ncbi:MAG TPA: condensation domain-containing protein, partial [Pyrinomonadaceae bacterium]